MDSTVHPEIFPLVLARGATLTARRGIFGIAR